mmetsp:Transcript_21230/g.59328  ORF Transcript_21230/g.59328 Transcript_21230/m.59328 type:complete len:275 (+) Transcript_21230:414-1238(+)
MVVRRLLAALGLCSFLHHSALRQLDLLLDPGFQARGKGCLHGVQLRPRSGTSCWASGLGSRGGPDVLLERHRPAPPERGAATATAAAAAFREPLALLGRRLCLERLDHLDRLDRLGLGLLQHRVQILGAIDEGQRELKATTDWICTAGELLDCRISDSPAAFALCIRGSLLRSERRGRGLDHASDHPLSSFRRRTPLPGRLVDLEHRGQESEVLAQKNPAQCLQCSASSWPRSLHIFRSILQPLRHGVPAAMAAELSKHTGVVPLRRDLAEVLQ